MDYRKPIDYKKVEALSKRGETWTSIASIIGISFTCLKNRTKIERPDLFMAIRSNGIARWGKHGAKIDRNAAFKLRADGWTYTAIAKHFNASYSSAAKMLNRKCRADRHLIGSDMS